MWPVTIVLTGLMSFAGGDIRAVEEVKQMKPLEGKKVVFIFAHRNFRDEELLVPKRILEERGAKVVLASSALGTAKGMLGAKVEPDLLVDSVRVEQYDAVVFVGGSGASEYWDDPRAHAIVKEAAQKDKLICAICIAPVTLANAGLLKGKKVTAWPSEAGRLKAKGATYTGRPVERDGKVITADGPRSAGAFAEAIVRALAEGK
ncbi:MAG TPA: DJ-1/PfpI family protein [Candidatus Latescibacteria bacterium]|nr:DJ-1/PfpI family protein [Candidatus Latescibacterota bacterium]